MEEWNQHVSPFTEYSCIRGNEMHLQVIVFTGTGVIPDLRESDIHAVNGVIQKRTNAAGNITNGTISKGRSRTFIVG